MLRQVGENRDQRANQKESGSRSIQGCICTSVLCHMWAATPPSLPHLQLSLEHSYPYYEWGFSRYKAKRGHDSVQKEG